MNCKRGTLRMTKSKGTLPPSLPQIPFLLTRGERTSGTGFEALQLQNHWSEVRVSLEIAFQGLMDCPF